MKIVTEMVRKVVRNKVMMMVRMRVSDSATVDQYFNTGVPS